MAPESRPGAEYLGDSCTRFVVWAPEAARVEVALDPSAGRRIPLEPRAGGIFRAEVADAPPGTRYGFSLDGAPPLPDPASRAQPDGVHGPSAVLDTTVDWTDGDFVAPTREATVLYELHVGTFTPEGTFDAALDRLPALADLGVTTVELMPVAQFPGRRNWGYDGVFPYAVQASYGGFAGLARFVDACHGYGLAVCLDVVYNHLGPEGNVLARYAPYFTDRYRTPWGEALNFDGPQSDAVRNFFIENACFWVEVAHVDALRLDAVHAITDGRALPFLEELTSVVHARAADAGRCALVIAESDDDDPCLVAPSETCGGGLDAQWADAFHHALHVTLTGERHGYYQDFDGLPDLARALEGGFVHRGRWSPFRRRRHGRPGPTPPLDRLVCYAQNHDQIGNRMLGDRLATVVSFEALKLAAATVVCSGAIPLIFMGEEVAAEQPFPYFVDHEDAALLDAVRRGRQREFAAFDWPGEPPDPVATETFARAVLGGHVGGARGEAMWRWYRDLLGLRRELVADGTLAGPPRIEVDEAARTLVVRRDGPCRRVLLAGVFGDAAATVGDLDVDVVLDSTAPEYGGAGAPADGRRAPWSALVGVSAS